MKMNRAWTFRMERVEPRDISIASGTATFRIDRTTSAGTLLVAFILAWTFVGLTARCSLLLFAMLSLPLSFPQ